MADNVEGFPYHEIEFDKHGDVHDDSRVSSFVTAIAESTPTDLLVVSHGWNNDMAQARELYRRLLEALRQHRQPDRILADRSIPVLAVLWPSKKFADQKLIPSGAADFGSPVTEDMIRAQLDELHGVFDGDDTALEEAAALVGRLDEDPESRARFADLLRSVVPDDAAEREDGTDRLFQLDGETLMARLSAPIPMEGPEPSRGGPATSLGPFGATAPTTEPTGEAALFAEFFGGFRAAARKLMNLATYYQMKARSQRVAERGLHPILRSLRKDYPDLRLHLVGHSFGARLVTATALGPPEQTPLGVDSLTLLQAAFSHHGFAHKYDGQHDGRFRQVIADPRVRGPALITHTSNDKAVGLAYPVASMLAGQRASGFGDEDSLFGALGRNGAQHTPETVAATLSDAATAYTFSAGKIHNLRADRYIHDHGDVANPETANALAWAIAFDT